MLAASRPEAGRAPGTPGSYGRSGDGIGLTPDLERLAALIGGSPTRQQAVTAGA